MVLDRELTLHYVFNQTDKINKNIYLLLYETELTKTDDKTIKVKERLLR